MNPKIAIMLPARYGSKRVPKKNLRLIDGKPLISYAIDAVLFSGVKADVYLNSDHEIFGEIAAQKGINFFKRATELAGDKSTNDEFALDFIEKISCDILIQVLPTSPLISPDEISRFVTHMIEGDYDSLISVEDKQIACVYQNEPINFEKLKINPPSQNMTPVRAYATVLMGWKSEKFKSNMKRFGAAYHGGDGKTGFFELRGLSTIDIDREEDFALAEAILVARKNLINTTPKYYGEHSKEHSESHVESILKKDGVEQNNLYDVNHEIVNISDILSSMDSSKSWSKRIIDSESNSMTVISQLPGEGNRLHYHPDWNEWWYIVDGEWEWLIEGEKKVIKKGDIVFMKKNRKHKITARGNKPAVRMAVSRSDVAHIYPENE